MALVLALAVFAIGIHPIRSQDVPGFPANAANRLDRPVNFTCPDGQAIAHVESNHYRRMNDRVWSFSCRDLPFKTEFSAAVCQNTTVPVNDFDEAIEYICPHTGAWAGAYSVHDNAHEDRRWSFRCCSHDSYCRRECAITGDLNEFRGPLNFTPDTGFYIVGIFSTHNDRYEDRRWAFEVCKIEPCGI